MIEITQGFTGYPVGKRRRFAAGEKPTDLSAEYEELIVSKGHARLAPVSPPSATKPPRAPLDID